MHLSWISYRIETAFELFLVRSPNSVSFLFILREVISPIYEIFLEKERGEGERGDTIKRRVRKFILGFGENGRSMEGEGGGGNTCARID